MGPNKTSHQHIATLDGLRGIAAAAVVWYHMTDQMYGGASIPFRGYISVDFFFVLSGLVVARSYEAKLLAGMTVWTFVKIRLVRLYPMILLGIACGLVAKLGSYFLFHSYPNIRVAQIFLSAIPGLLLIPCPSSISHNTELFPLDIPLWSLMLEVWVNIAYAVLVATKRRKLLLGVSSTAIVLCAGLNIIFTIKFGYLDGGSTLETLTVGLSRVGYAFFCGTILHLVLTPRRIAAIPAISFPALACLLLAILLPGSSFGAVYDIGIVLLVLPVLVALGAKDCAYGKWRGLALFMGSLSYPVYALHQPAIAHFTHLNHLSASEQWAIMAASFLAIIVLSYFALTYYDEPLRHWLKRMTARKTPPTFATVPDST